MKRNTIVTISSSLAFMLAGATAAWFLRSASIAQPTWVTYKDDADGYVMACPPSFSINRFGEGASCVSPHGVRHVGLLVLPTQAATVEEWMAMPDKGAFEYEQTAIAEGTTLGGVAAVRTAGAWSGRRYYALHGGKLYVLDASLNADEEPGFLARFRFIGK